MDNVIHTDDFQLEMGTAEIPAGQEERRRAGREGIVLLKNEKNLLPLKKNLKSVAVSGPDAENLLNQVGDYSPKAIPQHVVSILEGIKAKVEPGTKVTTLKGCNVLEEDKSGFAEAIHGLHRSKRLLTHEPLLRSLYTRFGTMARFRFSGTGWVQATRRHR
jgi:hypothetical protein